MKWIMIAALVVVGGGAWYTFASQDEAPMHEQVEDDEVAPDRWFRDDWPAAKARASAEDKPVLAVFRCVP